MRLALNGQGFNQKVISRNCSVFNSLPASGYFCHLLITFAKSLDSDQARQTVGLDLDPNCLPPSWYWNILRKTIEGYLNYFDNIIFDKIFLKQNIFVSDRTTNMQFSKMQNKIYGPTVMIQYHTKCTNPLYPKFTSKKFSVFIFQYNLYLVIAYALILTTDMFSHPFFQ